MIQADLADKNRTTIRRTHISGPLDRLFLKQGTAAGFILDFDGPAPGREHLATRVLDRAARLPALNLLAPPPGRQRWLSATGPLDKAAHFHHSILPPEQLNAATSELLHRSLPSDPHPPWDMWLLEDPARRQFRICYRIHHGIQDGVGAAHAVLALLADQAAAGPHPHRPAAPTPKGVLLAGRGFWDAVRPKGRWAALQAPPSHHTRWIYHDVPEARVREVAMSYGVTTNDVCLAALAQALRHWHRSHPALDGPCPDMHALMPMSLRQEHQRHALGNHLGSHRVTLPCSVPDLDQAVAHVHRQTDAVRASRTRDAFRLATRFLPTWLGERASNAFTARRSAPIVVSSVSLRATPTCLGAPLCAASMFGSLYNNRLCYVSFTRAVGIVRCGVLYDGALPQAAALPRLWSAVLLRREP
ncbi:wax ester/triacylglycerol synthase domain-containing protein [Streptomyces sp. NPDC006368]|uniref:wax ester/triacylglycerol synthase domain-containing protein n=1 Tax=Streptomyces sp. NPDC006368 TaxID=3156760 RepID=UPI0033AD8C1C